MATFFIFTEQLDEEHCLSLRLDEEGQVDAPFVCRPIHEAKALQKNARTIVVVPTKNSSLHEIELPWLSESKARAAIPYALEEQLAQNVSTLHFAFDREHYQNNRYLVVVTDKQFLLDLMAKLDALMLDFDVVTFDWFALQENEACVTDSGLLISDNLFKGALSGEPAQLYLSNGERHTQPIVFKDSLISLQHVGSTIQDGLSSVWVAERLLQAKMMNLCQGELQHDMHQQVSKYWFKASAIMTGVLLVSVVLINALHLHLINNKMVDVDKKIAVIYRTFFPLASQVISPKFRIGQLLQSGLASTDTKDFWSLLDKLAQAYDGKKIIIEQLHFQSPLLSVTLTANNFQALERLQQRLQQANVKVTQSQASSHEDKVLATLELSMGGTKP